jgi:hypothetical protein
VNKALPRLLTSGKIAELLGESTERVRRVLATRHHIRPAALAGGVRLYHKATVAQVRYALNLIDARRSGREGRHAAS